MGKGRQRHVDALAIHLSPLRGEQLDQPRFDGRYCNEQTILRFCPDGTVTFEDESCRWAMHGKLLTLSGTTLDLDASIGLDGLYVRRGVEPDKGHAEAVFHFEPDGSTCDK